MKKFKQLLAIFISACLIFTCVSIIPSAEEAAFENVFVAPMTMQEVAVANDAITGETLCYDSTTMNADWSGGGLNRAWDGTKDVVYGGECFNFTVAEGKAKGYLVTYDKTLEFQKISLWTANNDWYYNAGTTIRVYCGNDTSSLKLAGYTTSTQQAFEVALNNASGKYFMFLVEEGSAKNDETGRYAFAEFLVYAREYVFKPTVTFNYNGATTGNTELTRKVAVGATIGELPAPTKNGVTFYGWSVDGSNVIANKDIVVSNDMTLNAIWGTNYAEYTQHGDYNYISRIEPEITACSETKFIWDDSYKKSFIWDKTDNIDMSRDRPQWIVNGNRTETYNVNDTGRMVIENKTKPIGILFDLGELNKLSDVIISNTCTTSSNWAIDNRVYTAKIYIGKTEKDLEYIGTIKNTDTTITNKNLNFNSTGRYVLVVFTEYKTWENNGYDNFYVDEIEVIGTDYIPTVTFNYNGATTGNSELTRSVAVGTNLGDLPIPSKEGSTFAGWLVDGGNGQIATWNTVVNEDISLTATWGENLISASKHNYTYDYISRLEPEISACTDGTFAYDIAYEKSFNWDNKVDRPQALVDGNKAESFTADDNGHITVAAANTPIGLLFDLGDRYDINAINIHKLAAKNDSKFRNYTAKIYIGNDKEHLDFAGVASNDDINVMAKQFVTEKFGRYVLIVFINYEVYNNKLIIDELEVYGKEISHGYTNLLKDNHLDIKKLEFIDGLLTDNSFLNTAEYENYWFADRYEGIGLAFDGDTTTCTMNEAFKPTYQDADGKTIGNIGWLIDLESIHSLSTYRVYFGTGSDVPVDTRKQEGFIYAGNDKTALSKVAEFNNESAEECLDVNLSGVSARYVAVILTNTADKSYGFNWYGNMRTYMAEIELYGDSKGDLANDGQINVLDLIRLKKYEKGLSNVTIDKGNRLMTEYDSSVRLLALRRFILTLEWERSNVVNDTVNRVNWNMDMTLRAEGNKIVDAKGNTVRFAGVNLTSLGVKSAINGIWDEFYLAIKDWKCNAMRVSITPQFMPNYVFANGDESGSTEEDWNAYLSIIDRVVSEAVRYDVYVILTNHDASLPTEPRAIDVEFWNIIASRYANCPNVVFGLFNEPHCGRNLSAWNSKMQTLVDAVRATGANNLLTATGDINGNYWEGFSSQYMLRDTANGNGIMYEIHRYSYSALDSQFDPLFNMNVPVFLGEFNANQGIYHDDTDNDPSIQPWDLIDQPSKDFMNGIMAFIERENINFTAYTLSDFAPYLLKNRYPYYEPTASGQIVKDYIAEVNNVK